MELAISLRGLVGKTVERAHDLIKTSRSLTDLSSAMKIAETAGKITGIVKEEDVIDLTVNQISGFTFVQINNNQVQPTSSPLLESRTIVEDEDDAV
jgi:hypothetical protein